MLDWRSAQEWKRVWRYYQAGVVNTLFGYGLFALFIWTGFNIYVAQIFSHVLGMTFNYFTYSRYAFAGHQGSTGRFVASYIFNYLLGLFGLAAVSRLVSSPYVAGLASIVFVSVVNFFVLKRLVFQSKAAHV